MSREPDLEAIVHQQAQQISRLTAVLRWIGEQADAVPADGPLSILLAEIGSRVRMALTEATR